MTTYWWQAATHPLNAQAQADALARQNVLTKPTGALGELENIAVRLAAMQAKTCPQLNKPWISIFAADHGIAAVGVSAYPQAVTAQMVANFATGGAAICVLSQHIGAQFEVIDVGVASDTREFPGVIQAKQVNGTANFLEQPAMSLSTLEQALLAGKAAVERALASGADCFIGGEMGIGNTTSASALASVWLDLPPSATTGAGTGLDAPAITRKALLIAEALQRHHQHAHSDVNILAALGGCEIVALAGAYIAAAQAGLPVLVDGFISSVAALAATRLNAGVADWLFFGHVSAEQAHKHVLAALNATPLLQLNMRLGEGSGAASAFPILQMACALHSRMATFAEAVVSNRA